MVEIKSPLPQSIDFTEEIDFSKAIYTAIVSDLHLCEAEPPNRRHPLWKKFKTREFFFDEDFKDMLERLHEKANGKAVELVLNGDIFDFDSVTSYPQSPGFKVSWLESRRGLDSEREKSLYKIEVILRDHPVWVSSLSWFIKEGHKVVFVIGNHDLELNWTDVQKYILDSLELNNDQKRQVRFAEWFYISNKDTLIEHGHQYDPYCAMEDPINPVVIDYNRLLIRLPFGDLACRYLSNGVGFFNPHIDTHYSMTLGQYLKVFFKYMMVAQPLIIWTWFWTSVTIFVQTIRHAILRELKNPLTIEDRINEIARKANATPRMVREMTGLFVQPAADSPLKLLKELWLDRAFLLLVGLFGLLYLFLIIDRIYDISFYWIFIPILLLLPPYVLYSRSVQSFVHHYKKPSEHTLSMAGMITGVKRIVYGHTHVLRHEIIGAIEHFNPGTWSPAFLDIECTRAEEQRAYVWIEPVGESGARSANLLRLKSGIVSLDQKNVANS